VPDLHNQNMHLLHAGFWSQLNEGCTADYEGGKQETADSSKVGAAPGHEVLSESVHIPLLSNVTVHRQGENGRDPAAGGCAWIHSVAWV
jgi:hypothetical protein